MDIVERLRSMAAVETSALYSQRKTLNEAADMIDILREKNDRVVGYYNKAAKRLNELDDVLWGEIPVLEPSTTETD